MSRMSLEMLSAWSWKDSEIGTLDSAFKSSQNRGIHVDLLSFLAVVQELGINILPITWNDGLNSIGFGGTAVLREAMVDLKTSFAFKHIVGENDEERARGFRVLVNEVTALGHPSFQAHPNIVTLHGICWHTPTGEERVEPALVIEKAEHKDLHGFLSAEHGSNLGFSQRISICFDVARGLSHGHQYGILHGDVKPQNILIFSDDDGYIAKISDYGFSSLAASGDVSLAISKPWEAPELGECEYSPKVDFTTAIRAEVYSFGLLCLWLLFYECKIPASETRIGDIFNQNETGINTIHWLKAGGRILPLALELVNSSSEIPAESKARLAEVFQSLVAFDPINRTANLQNLIVPLESDERSTMKTSENVYLEPISAHFQIIKSIDVLIESHLIVRKYIVFSLLEQWRHAGCIECRTNAIEQLSLCSKLGFGNPTQGLVDEEVLSDSPMSGSKIDKMMELVRNTEFVMSRRAGSLQPFEDHGFLGALEYSEEYVKTPIQEVLDREYPLEIEKMAEALGNGHIFVYNLRNQYDAILFRQGAYREARPLVDSLCKDLRKDLSYGTEHVLTQRATSLLAAVYWALGEYQEAAALEHDLLAVWEKTQGTENLGYIHLQRSHANTLRDQGNYKEAAVVEEKLWKTSEAVVGGDHPTTLSVMANLAVTYSNEGRYAEAEELEVKVLESRTAVLGQRHRDTVMAMANLAFTYRDLARWEDAETLEKLVWLNRQDTFGPDNPETLRAMINLSNTWMNQGYFAEDDNQELHDSKFHEAQQLISKAVETSECVLGAEHPDTLMAISSLTHCYRNTGHLDQALVLDQQLVDARISSLGEVHPATLKSIFNLALTLRGMGDLESAKLQGTRCFDGRVEALGAEHPLTLDAKVFLDSLVTYVTGQK